VNGQRIVDVAKSTLDASETLVGTWTTLEPIVKRLITKVAAYADGADVQAAAATTLLKDVAGVTRAVAQAATAVMRASEGQARLAVLIAGPQPKRLQKETMTERQLVAVVMETARTMRRETGGPCPLCTRTLPRYPKPQANGTPAGAPAADGA